MPDRAGLTPRRLRLVCAALLAAETAWAAAGLVFPSLPGWRMFARVERAGADLRDARGAAVDLYEFVPRDVYVPDRATARAVAAFVCRAQPERAPWALLWRADGGRVDACAR